MPIIICPECGGKVSTTLSACPHCGYKIDNNVEAPKPEPSVQNEKCLLNIKREHRQIGKVMDWYVYNNDKFMKTLLNGEVFTISLKRPGKYRFTIYHANNAPTTKPLSRANVKPAVLDLDVGPNDKEINVVVDINTGVFSGGLVITSINRR